jgi:hypothetical protein
MINTESLKREKLLFAYTSALERGDFARLETILESALGDVLLGQQIDEINLVLSQPQQAASARSLLQGVGAGLWLRLRSSAARRLTSIARFRPSLPKVFLGLGATLIVIFGVLALLGPAIGKVFSNVVTALPEYAYGRQPVAQTQVVEGYNYGSAYPIQPQAPAPTSAPAATQVPNQPSIQVPEGRMIVRNATLSVLTADTRQARQAVVALVAEFAGEGAFVVSANESYPYGNQMPAVSMVLRVPVNRYDESMTRLAALGTQVLGRVETAQDVTQAYVDTTARIQALQTSRARLLEIIQNAKTTDDLLRAEQELSRREADLNAALTVQQNLAKTAALSSISLELRPAVTSQPVAGAAWDPGATLHNAVSALLGSLRNLADGAIFFAVTTLPWLALLGLLVYGSVRLLGRRAKK